MPAKKKKFIDKKNAVTFHLVHRSQKDPLQADEEAPQHVLLEVSDKDKKETRKEAQQKFGVFFDDDYDYLQHLKDAEEINDVGPGAEIFRIEAKEKKKQEPTIQLSSQLFGSELETDVGLLNKAAPLRGPQLDWDPDIVAGLDEDFDFDNPDNQLNDDFMSTANAVQLPDSLKDGEGFASDEAEDDFSDAGSFGQHSFDDVETKSRFTSYTTTSSVMHRNEGLTLLDDRFEKMYEQYDDDEIGALDQDDIGGCLSTSSKILTSVMDEFDEITREIKLKDAIQKAENIAVASESDSESSDDPMIKMTIAPKKEQWDCESILSTYSTLYNHPKTISEPKNMHCEKLSKQSEVSMDCPAEHGLTLQQLQQLNNESLPKANTIRPRGENAEEKKARKQAIKTERKQRREDKKQNKTAFKSEEIRQNKEQLNIRNNLQGMKIT